MFVESRFLVIVFPPRSLFQNAFFFCSVGFATEIPWKNEWEKKLNFVRMAMIAIWWINNVDAHERRSNNEIKKIWSGIEKQLSERRKEYEFYCEMKLANLVRLINY